MKIEYQASLRTHRYEYKTKALYTILLIFTRIHTHMHTHTYTTHTQSYATYILVNTNIYFLKQITYNKYKWNILQLTTGHVIRITHTNTHREKEREKYSQNTIENKTKSYTKEKK